MHKNIYATFATSYVNIATICPEKPLKQFASNITPNSLIERLKLTARNQFRAKDMYLVKGYTDGKYEYWTDVIGELINVPKKSHGLK